MTETDEAKRLRIHQLWQAKLDVDPWNGWRALLNNWEIEGTKVPVDPNTPFTGYYRSRKFDPRNPDKKNQPFEPVAYWKDGDAWVCLRGGVELSEEKAIAAWPHVSRRPISYAWYELAISGQPWPDADARVTEEALEKSAEKPKEPETAKIGHNNPPEETPVELLRNKIANAKGGLKDYEKITTEEQQTKARSLKNRLTELKGEGEAEREKFSRPHLDELTAIRAEWSPLINEAEAAAKTIVTAMDIYETMLLNKRREDERKAAEVEAERIRIAAENAKLAEKAELDGSEPEYQKLPEQPKPTAPPPRTEVSAAYGRKGSVKTKFVVTEITDAAKLFTFLTTPKMHSELRVKMLELAQRAKDAGFEPDGVKIEEVAQVKG